MNLSLDREEMIEVLSPNGGQIQCYYPCVFDWIYGYDDYAKMPGFRFDNKADDIAAAQALMADAGLADGLDVTMTFRGVGSYPDVAAVLLQQWKSIGFNIELRQMESAAGFAAYQKGDFTINMQGTGLNFLDPDAANDLLYLPTAGRNYSGPWENAEFLALFDKGKMETDQAKRGEIYRQMTDILMVDVPYTPTTGGVGYIIQWECVRGYTAPDSLGQNNYRHDRTWLGDGEPCNTLRK